MEVEARRRSHTARAAGHIVHIDVDRHWRTARRQPRSRRDHLRHRARPRCTGRDRGRGGAPHRGRDGTHGRTAGGRGAGAVGIAALLPQTEGQGTARGRGGIRRQYRSRNAGGLPRVTARSCLINVRRHFRAPSGSCPQTAPLGARPKACVSEGVEVMSERPEREGATSRNDALRHWRRAALFLLLPAERRISSCGARLPSRMSSAVAIRRRSDEARARPRACVNRLRQRARRARRGRGEPRDSSETAAAVSP